MGKLGRLAILISLNCNGSELESCYVLFSQGDADVVACWHEAGEYSITTGYNKPNSHTFIRDGSEGSGSEMSPLITAMPRLDRENTRIADKLFHCR